MNRLILAILVASLTHPAWGVCPDVAPESARAATVVGGAARVHFIKDSIEASDCPGLAVACQARGYVIPGDIVVIGAIMGGFTCASFTGGTGASTYGWLPSAALSPMGEPVAADWAGHWRRIEADIVIERAGAALRVQGDATWGAMDPERVRHGGVNIGDIAATATPVDGLLAFTAGVNATLPYDRGGEYDCRAKMRRAGPYLVVADNGNCGGHNVSFTGVYRRR